jgi:hypothetical protein
MVQSSEYRTVVLAEYKMEYLLWLMTLNSVTNPWIYLAFNQAGNHVTFHGLVWNVQAKTIFKIPTQMLVFGTSPLS